MLRGLPQQHRIALGGRYFEQLPREDEPSGEYDTETPKLVLIYAKACPRACLPQCSAKILVWI